MLWDCLVGAHTFDAYGLRWSFRVLERDPCAFVVVTVDALFVCPPVGIDLVSKFKGQG